MFHRELTAAELNDAVLLDLLRMEDPVGVLSVFVEMPADGTDRRAEIEIAERLGQHRAGPNARLSRRVRAASYLYRARRERMAGEDDG